MRESRTLEYKESITNTFLKTVSAFANYGSGEIIFGIADDGRIIGIPDLKAASLDIENRINDSIDPVPEYTLSINEKTSVITLRVQEGLHKPYLYKAKAYRRNDTATIAVDRLELARLILEGQNSSFEELPASDQDLSFQILEDKLIAELHIDSFSKDTLKTLELYQEGSGFNKAGELLADRNKFCGIDMVRFGDNINIILDRKTVEHVSILKQFDQALDMFRQYYEYERIKGSTREKISLIPEEAFREAVANALVHRTWDIDSHVNIAMFQDRIRITSPGDLPRGVSEEEYLRGGISILRNPIIGNVFYRLHMIEKFGTGIRRINDTYQSSMIKPVFTIGENTICIDLPVLQEKSDLLPDEQKVFALLKNRELPSSAIVEATGFGKSKTVTILNKLVNKGYIMVSGTGRGTKYKTGTLS
jgi:ATP-dependent DNA helicase RecG